MKTLLFLFFIAFFPISDCLADNQLGGDGIEERVIEIKGKVEKPRVIFIVPKARLGNIQKPGGSEEVLLKKSFISDILRPVYPDLQINKEQDGHPAGRE